MEGHACDVDQIFALWSSEHEASSRPRGDHEIAFTSLWCPTSRRIGSDLSKRHIWIVLSVEHVAYVSAFRQHTSRTAPVWAFICCFRSPVFASHTMAELSTEPVKMWLPVLEYLSENTGPVCASNVRWRRPAHCEYNSAETLEPRYCLEHNMYIEGKIQNNVPSV